MKRIYHLLFLLLLIHLTVFGQRDSNSIYLGLDTNIYSAVSLSNQIVNGVSIYKVNGKPTTKVVYDKYKNSWGNMSNCCPCYLKTYDIKEKIQTERVACQDCSVGSYTLYTKKGKVKLTGSYKENPTGNWDNLWERGYCSVKDGQWTYYNNREEIQYKEIWDNGSFIKQIPEQSKMEIWDINMTLNKVNVDTQSIKLADVKNLIFLPQFKNSNTKVNLMISVTVSAIGHKENTNSFKISDFKNIDVKQMLNEVGISVDESFRVSILIQNKRKLIKRFNLKIEV